MLLKFMILCRGRIVNTPAATIQGQYDGDKASCARTVKEFLASGSHFVTNEEWGCKDGDHKAWLIVETESKADALRILPASHKINAKITRINKFTRADMEEVIEKHHT
jgi:hypothetical protein